MNGIKRKEGIAVRREINMLDGPLTKNILLYALPLALTGILQQLFNAADVAVVGRLVGTEAMAAVGSNTAIISLIVNLFVGISIGTNVVLAHAIGMRSEEDIHRTVHSSILLALSCGFVMAVPGVLLAPKILSVTGVPEEVLGMATMYLRIYMSGLPVILLYNFEASVFRAYGDTRTPLLTLVISGLINVALNIFCVAVLGMTVDGVAIATVVSNLVSAVILFIRLLKSDDVIRVRWPDFHFDGRILRRILQIGVPSGVQSAMFSLSNVVVQSAINSLGAVIMAAASAAFNVEVFAYYVMNSFTHTCTSFVGQNYGAGQLDRCRKIYFRCILLDYLCCAVVCSLILCFGHTLLGLFNPDPEVVRYGYQRIVVIFFAYIFSIWQEVGSGYLRGFGTSTLPAVVALLGICGVRILWISTVFPLYPSYTTILLVYPLTLGIAGIAITAAIAVKKPSRCAESRS